MICGKCHATDTTITHVKACYAAPAAADYRPMALAPVDVPASKYAIVIKDELRFYEVKHGTKNTNVRFVDQLIGHPGSWLRVKISDYAQRTAILNLIRADFLLDEGPAEEPFADGPHELRGPQAAAVRYSREFTCCAACSSPLSVPLSRARGLGPDCYERFAA